MRFTIRPPGPIQIILFLGQLSACYFIYIFLKECPTTHSFFSQITNKAALSNTPILFVIAHSLRLFFASLTALFIVTTSPNTHKIIFIAIIAEVTGIISNFWPVAQPFSSQQVISHSVIGIVLIVAYLVHKRKFLSFNTSTYDVLNNTIPNGPAYNDFDNYSFINKPRFYKQNSFFMPIILLGIIAISSIGIYAFRHKIISELQFFIHKTSFLADSGLDKWLSKIDNKLINKTSNKNYLRPSDIQKNTKTDQLRKKFTNRLYSKRILKKQTTHYETAHAFLNKKNYSAAVKEFNMALGERQTLYSRMLTHYFLAKTYENNFNDYKKALLHWKKIKKMPKPKKEYQMNLPSQASKEINRLKKKLSGKQG